MAACPRLKEPDPLRTSFSMRKRRCSSMGRSTQGGPSTSKPRARGMGDPLITELGLIRCRCPFLPALSARTAHALPTCRAIRSNRRGLLRNIGIYLTQQKAQILRILSDPTTQWCHETPIFQKTRISQMCRRNRRCEKTLDRKGRVAESIINN